MREFLFDDINSLIHALLGILVAYIVLRGYGLIGALMFDLFLMYELLEYENPVSTIGDVLEFVVGFLNGMMVIIGGGI